MQGGKHSHRRTPASHSRHGGAPDILALGRKRRPRWAIAVLVGLLLGLVLVVSGGMPAQADHNNRGDTWLQNVSVTSFAGHQHDPHLACEDINLWGAGMAETSGNYTIDAWPPNIAPGTQVYPTPTTSGTWNYSGSGPQDKQIMDVIDVETLIANAISAGAVEHPQQGYHFKLQFVQTPQKHKTFWVKCEPQLQELKATVIAHKYGDTNANQIQDSGELNLGGWSMTLWSAAGCTGSQLGSGSTASGSGDITLSSTLDAGTYYASETLQANWANTTPLCQSVTVAAGETKRVDFGNRQTSEVLGEEIVRVAGGSLPRTGPGESIAITATAGLIAILIGGALLRVAARREAIKA